MIGNIIANTIPAIASSIFGRRNEPAVEAPQITNIQTVGENQDSGTESIRNQTMQANPFGALGPQALVSLAKRLPGVAGALGLGTGSAIVASQFLGNGDICESPMQRPYNVNKVTGCITISRKQQQALKNALMYTDIPTLAASIGLDPMQLCQLLLKRFKARGRGITAASMRTTKRTIRQIKSLHNEVSSMAGRKTPVRRTAAVKQVKYSN